MLYIVGTPIGNLEDLSVRQAKILASVEIILTEDTRTTGTLLQKIPELFQFQIAENQKLLSYYKENEFEKLPQILDLLREEKEVALISQAGMPVISDPGYLLIKTVIKEELPLTVIPGPTAATTGLVLSGFPAKEHMFLGFLPKKENDIKKVFEKVKQTKHIFPDITFIFYESPLRILETLRILQENVPELKVCVARELTKKFEEVLRGTAEELQRKQYKGEIVLLLN